MFFFTVTVSEFGIYRLKESPIELEKELITVGKEFENNFKRSRFF